MQGNQIDSLRENLAITDHQARLSKKRGCSVSRDDAIRDWEAHHAITWRETTLAEDAQLLQNELEIHISKIRIARNSSVSREATFTQWINNHYDAWLCKRSGPS